MTGRSFRAAAALALAASLTLAATPALAAVGVGAIHSDSGQGIVLTHDHWGGWDDGYRGWGHHHDIDAGDVITGVLILGGIAAIASAASNANKSRRTPQYRTPEQTNDRWPNDTGRDDTWRNGDERPTYQGSPGAQGNGRYSQSGSYDPSAMNRAIDDCVGAIERNHRVDGVDTVNRDAGGYSVRGTVRGGQAFACTVGADGRIGSATVG